MRYHSEPWRNRILGDGWSHNPYKRLVGMDDDPDIRATIIAEKYIGLMTDYLRERGWLPLMGVEVNFTPYGIDPQKLIDTMAGMQHEAQKRVHAKRPEKRPGGSVLPLHLKLHELPVWAESKPNNTDAYDLDFPHMKVRKKETPPQEKGEVPFDLSVLLKDIDYLMDDQLIEDFGKRAERLKNGDPLTPFEINQCYLLMRMLAGSAERGAILRINPELWNTLKGLCETITRERGYDQNAGMISRIYLDGNSEFIEDPEITTPPREPLVTVRNTNAIKQMLLESTYRFKGDDRTAASATKLRENVGDIDISFLHPEGYYNLPEHLNFSVLQTGEGLRDYEDLRRHPNPDLHNVTRDTQGLLMRSVLDMFLPADRLLTIGNRFPYDEAKQLGLKYVHSRVDHIERVANRVELKNFHDATSNIALSALAVMGVACDVRHSMDELGMGAAINSPREMMDLLGALGEKSPACELPRGPKEAVALFKKHSPALRGMRLVGEAMLGPDALPEIERDMAEFSEAVIRRQELLLKRPWGGKARAQAEGGKGWHVANLELAQAREAAIAAASDSGPGL